MPTVFEIFCECGAVLAVYIRVGERPLVQCPACGVLADCESIPTARSDWLAGYEEDGPDVQVVLVGALP